MGVSSSKLSWLIGGGRAYYKRLRGTSSCSTAQLMTTPKGYVPICVGLGNDTKLFIVHTTALGDADFLQFLCKSAEEYGFCNEGILRIPCEAEAHQDGNKAGEAKMLPKKHFVHQMKRMNGLKNPVVWPMVTALQHTDSSRSGAKNPTCFGSCLVLRALSSSCQFTPVPSLMKQGPGASACSLNQKDKIAA
ncbi:auxin responsive protein [Citrus sinensis]|uniref:Auxin responsive protein n=1 Tax=Citrus sinensis TaxID=2711 RepID=A0ACB8J8C2_CITSI|nr:auxin responsive protein [Citrus sinensis]